MTTAEDVARVTAGVEQARCDHARNMRDVTDNEDCGELATFAVRSRAQKREDSRFFCARHAAGWNRSLRGNQHAADFDGDNWIVTRIGVTP